MIDIRIATDQDIPIVEEILLDAVNWLNSIEQPLWSKNTVTWESLSKKCIITDFVIAFLDGNPVGCMSLTDVDQEFWPNIPKGKSLFIHKLAVKRLASGKGVSTALIEYAKEQCRINQINTLRLDCHQYRPKLRAFYENCGFVCVDERCLFGKYFSAFYELILEDKMNTNTNDFITALSSKSPTPGGGGASALAGALGAALCAMVANLTTGKKKYEQYQPDINQILTQTESATQRLLSLIDKDAKVFAPLAAAYGMPKDEPHRDEILESALLAASEVPLELLKEIHSIIGIAEELQTKGSRLAISDIGVAAAMLRASAEGAAMNVFINTKLMKNRETARDIDSQTETILRDCIERCNAVYINITNELKGQQ